MGLLQYLGLDDLADSVNEFTTGFDELKDEIISSVVGPTEELKNTVTDIVSEVQTDENAS
jgi:hypothetical protein